MEWAKAIGAAGGHTQTEIYEICAARWASVTADDPLRKSLHRQLKGLIDYNEITLAVKVLALTYTVIREFPIKIPVLYNNLMQGWRRAGGAVGV